MSAHDDGEASGGVRLVVVAFYVQTLAGIDALIRDFARSSGLAVASALVVDNGGALPCGRHGHVEIRPGCNSFWEFSAWSEGLGHVDPSEPGLIVLLNDSFGRNWSIKWPGRRVIRAMMREAGCGRIAGWLDNFSRVERRVNSRIVILPSHRADLLRGSIDAAIRCCRTRAADDSLFDAPDRARLIRWFATQDGRWTATSMASRLQRIFVEHHLFDAIPPEALSLHPSTWIGSQFYGLLRKLAGERR